MEQSTAQRRLVKSPPELWAEVSSEDALARRLAPFGEIRITRVEPETTVAWEGERASGTVELAPAGWGTKVTLTATPASDEPAAQQAPPPAPPPTPTPIATAPPPPAEPVTPPAPQEPKHGFLARLFRRRGTVPVPEAPAAAAAAAADSGPPAPDPGPGPLEPDPAPTAAVAVAAQPRPPLDEDRTSAILSEVLDDLGAAHHRPFSRG